MTTLKSNKLCHNPYYFKNKKIWNKTAFRKKHISQNGRQEGKNLPDHNNTTTGCISKEKVKLYYVENGE